MHNDTLSLLCEYCCFLRTVKISGKLDDVYCLRIFQCNPNISSLNLRANNILVDGIVKYLPLLMTHLDISGNLTHEGIDKIEQRCTRLKYFRYNIENWFEMQFDMIESSLFLYVSPDYFDGYKRHSLNYSGLRILSLWFDQCITQSWLEPLITANAATVTELIFNDSSEFVNETNVSALLKPFTQLTKLSLLFGQCNPAAVLPDAPLLSSLHFDAELTIDDMISVLNRFQCLTSFDIVSFRFTGRYPDNEFNALVSALRCYRNVLDGSSIKFSLHLRMPSCEQRLSFDGEVFSGNACDN